MTPQPRSTISLGDIIYKAEAKAGTKASRSPFDVPIDYTPNRQGNVASSSTSSETKFVPAFHHKGEVQFAPRVKRGDGSHKAVTVSEGGKTVKVEVNYKWEAKMITPLRCDEHDNCYIDYCILGALKLHKDTAKNVTITIFFQHIKEETYNLSYAQTDFINKMVNILKHFKLDLLKVAITTQTGKMEWNQTQVLSCFYRIDVPQWEFWLKVDAVNGSFKRLYEGSALERRLAGLAKAKAKRVKERRTKKQSKEVKEKLSKVEGEKVSLEKKIKEKLQEEGSRQLKERLAEVDAEKARLEKEIKEKK